MTNISLAVFRERDLAIINEILTKYYPSLGALVTIVRFVDARVDYPILSFDHVVEMVGADAEPLRGGLPVQIADFRSVVPAYYFPVTSFADLVAKAVLLQRSGVQLVAAPDERAWRAHLELREERPQQE